MTHKDQLKILNNKIECNTNQYKVDRLNAEISAFSRGDLNKYEFLTRKDLKYKPNALDKGKFEFSPLSKAFSMGLDKTADVDKTADGYQEEGVIRLLKDIRDGIASNVIRPNRLNNRPNNDNNNDMIHHICQMMKMILKKYNLLLNYFKLRKNIKEIKDDNKEVELKKKTKRK